MPLAVAACGRNRKCRNLGRLSQCRGGHLCVDGAEDQAPACRVDRVGDLLPRRSRVVVDHSSPASTASRVCCAVAIWREEKPIQNAATPTMTAMPATHSSE